MRATAGLRGLDMRSLMEKKQRGGNVQKIALNKTNLAHREKRSDRDKRDSEKLS